MPLSFSIGAEIVKRFAKVNDYYQGWAVKGWFGNIENNLKGAFNAIQIFLQYAVSEAIVINVLSVVAYRDVSLDGSAYSVSKSVVVRFFQVLAFEHPYLKVFHVQPDIIATDMAKDGIFLEDGPKLSEVQHTFKDMFNDISLPGSFVVWLASPEGNF
ncbi:hypothetical protein P154DRAFT_619337 [Amniculicola lignicola CBS 123094]|uniref:NAD(P)-binding protein n=1 Tax=Amniculicola lignicola CBS 123094 TaxID=1392246 RepID=A0A6A5WLN6_9PLEO|nr:hypothetical protein P154DRAFT_619337 [Amniculicola lignicola CBS 123094]